MSISVLLQMMGRSDGSGNGSQKLGFMGAAQVEYHLINFFFCVLL